MIGFFVGLGAGVMGIALVRWWWPPAPKGLYYDPRSVPFYLELLRRAHRAHFVCAVRRDVDPVHSRKDPGVTEARARRTMGLATLAANEGSQQTLRDVDLIVAAGEDGCGVAALLPGSADESAATALRLDLQSMAAGLAQQREAGVYLASDIRSTLELPQSIDTLPSIAFKLCERARTISNLATAVVLQDAGKGAASVVSVSYGADRRLVGRAIPKEAAAARACRGDTPLVADDMVELLGGSRADRRRSGAGAAYPLRDGRVGFGALVLFGRPSELGRDVWEQVMWLAADMGPQLAAAAAVQAAEDRALRDPLTGLPNRAALDRAVGGAPAGPNSVLCVDLDYFKRLNDTHGHAAGDAALRHVAGLFRRALREGDLAARVGGEEFALWLASTDAPTALEVAERVRTAIEETPFEWAGHRIPITCSVGVASTDSPEAVLNLVTAADAALYRAKRGGRNRVEVASGVGRTREPAAEASR